MRNVTVVDKSMQRGSERETLIRGLCDFAVKGIVPMFDSEKKVFCYRIRKTRDGLVREGESFRYTIITLLGLKRYEQHFGASPISIYDVLDETLNNSASIRYAGDAGLMLWLTALVAPERIGDVYSRLDITKALDKYPDATQGMTTELSWLLTGLCYAMLNGGKSLSGITDTAVDVFKIVKGNYGQKGVFMHQSGKSIAGVLRGNISCFADQVYPIYALVRFAETHGDTEALMIARQCSETICELQGSYGQWWWHYDARTGKTAGRYPVYSVHQEGMAPMALFAVGERTATDYEGPIYKGLEWILGKNELGIDMRDADRHAIWRSFYRKKWTQNRELLLSMMGSDADMSVPPDLEVLYECRPYCFGWLLYAFADKVGKQPSMHHALNSKEK